MRALLPLALAVLAAPCAAAQADRAAPDPVAVEAPAGSAAPDAPAAETAEPPAPRPLAFTASGTGLAVALPPGWTATEATEGGLPAYARYAFTDGAATLLVERVVGLNELDRQRWTRGQTTYGYHGLTPVGPAAVPLPGLGLAVEGPGVAGAVAFAQRGQAFWAVHVRAPEAVWAARRGALAEMLAGVTLP